VTINVDEGPAFGVALLAGVATGVWSSVEEACDATIRPGSATRPSQSAQDVYNPLYSIYRSLYEELKAEFHVLAQTGL
jgi:xylulokinase